MIEIKANSIRFILAGLLLTAIALLFTVFSMKRSLQKVEDELKRKSDTLAFYKIRELAFDQLLAKDFEAALSLFEKSDSVIIPSVSANKIKNFVVEYHQEKTYFDSIFNRAISEQQVNSKLRLQMIQQNEIQNLLKFYQDSLHQELSQTEGIVLKLTEQIIRLKTDLEKAQNRYGRLTFVNANGKTVNYFGEIADGKANGFGMATFENRGFYEGFWKGNKRHGKGKYKWSNNDIFEGEFVNDKKEGFGIYFFASGEKYEGNWLNDLRDGYGKLTNQEGNVVADGQWKQDKYIRKSP
ncbi:MAG: MORN repeat-containing protein [Flavobacteriales bacterium]